MSLSWIRRPALLIAGVVGIEFSALGSAPVSAVATYVVQQTDGSGAKEARGNRRGGEARGGGQRAGGQSTGGQERKEGRGTRDRAGTETTEKPTTTIVQRSDRKPPNAGKQLEGNQPPKEFQGLERTQNRLDRKSERAKSRAELKHGPPPALTQPKVPVFAPPPDRMEKLRPKEDAKNASSLAESENLGANDPSLDRPANAGDPSATAPNGTSLQVGAAAREAAARAAAAKKAEAPRNETVRVAAPANGSSEVRVNREDIRTMALLEKTHRERVARLRRLLEIAEDAQDETSAAKIRDLTEQQQRIYTSALESLREKLGEGSFGRAKELALANGR